MAPFMSQAPRPYSTPSRTSAGERVAGPGGGAGRHHVGVAGEAEMRSAGANAGEQVFDLAVAQPVHREAQASQRLRQHVLRPGIGRRDRGAAYQRLGQRQGVSEAGQGRYRPEFPAARSRKGEGDVTRRHLRSPAQSRSSSLIEVFARVCASTVFTITAQYSDGPGEPSGNGLPGSDPGTTTE